MTICLKDEVYKLINSATLANLPMPVLR